jgi:DNA-binding NtrC family response regulator
MARTARIENVGLSRAGHKCTAEIDNLTGCRVLVLEDEYFLAKDLERELTARGAIVVGPFAEISRAKDQVANGGFDVALIDIDLRGEPSFRLRTS